MVSCKAFSLTLNPFVRTRNAVAFFVCTFCTICCFVLLNAAQPFVLDRVLHLESGKHGRYTASLVIVGEIVVICTAHAFGTASDRLGRRTAYIFGFALLSATSILYPYSPSFPLLVLFRAFFSMGGASLSSMITTVMADYFAAACKGRAAGMVGISSGLGAIFAAVVLLRIPSILTARGIDELAAGRAQFWAGAVVALGGILTALMIAHIASRHEQKKGIFATYKEGLAVARRDATIALGYMAGFCARGDSVIITTFVSLWVYSIEVAKDTPTAQANSRAGMVSGVAQTCSIVCAPIVGFLTDRLDKRVALAVVSLFAALSYGVMAFVSDPSTPIGLVLACCIGAGEMGVIVGSQAVVAQHAPARATGSVGGVMALAGSIGILMAALLGGAIFDSGFFGGPLLLFAVLNGAVGFGAIFVRFKQGRDVVADDTPTDAEIEVQPLDPGEDDSL